MKPRKDSLAATDLSKSAYCEQQVVLDRKYGAKRKEFVTQRASEGNRMHVKAHREAIRHLKRDSRCFIATSVYGPDASQTNRLRQFRDESLLSNWWGCLITDAYYAVSPWYVRVIERSASLHRLTTYMLDRLLCKIEKGKGE